MRIGNASRDERGQYHGGKAGDQDKGEVKIQAWYDRPWVVVARALDSANREKIAVYMEQACANDNIGQDQQERNTLLTKLKANGFNFTTVGPCETDCSALAGTICIAIGVPESLMVIEGNLVWTGNIEAQLRKSGMFEFFDGYDFLKITDNLRRGDILIYHKGKSGHVAVALDNGSKVSNTVPAPAVTVPTNNSGELLMGQEVKLVPGATYYNGQSIPNWVFNTKLYVRGIKGDNITISTQKSGAITGVVKRNALQEYAAPAAQGYRARVKVNSYLNVRSGPSTGYAAIGRLYNNNEVTIVTTKNGWGEISTGGWISLNYTAKI